MTWSNPRRQRVAPCKSMSNRSRSRSKPVSARSAASATIKAVIAAIHRQAQAHRARIDAALPEQRLSALNLAHYIGLRSQEIRALQLDLAALGLSSLGRSEGHVCDTLSRLQAWLEGDESGKAARDKRPGARTADPAGASSLDSDKAHALLRENTQDRKSTRLNSSH